MRSFTEQARLLRGIGGLLLCGAISIISRSGVKYFFALLPPGPSGSLRVPPGPSGSLLVPPGAGFVLVLIFLN